MDVMRGLAKPWCGHPVALAAAFEAPVLLLVEAFCFAVEDTMLCAAAHALGAEYVAHGVADFRKRFC